MTRLDVGEEVDESPAECDGPRLLVLESREVPLGGVRAMSVSRSLPQRDLPMVGAWCFLDRFGPQSTRMRVEPHPHIGLQTVTWMLEGEVRHRDAVGSDVVIRPGSLNLMTSGDGIAHSEYSVGEAEIPLDALQLWVALPEGRRRGAPAFERHDDLPVRALEGGATAIVVVGQLGDTVSPATMHTPIVGAELRLPAGTAVTLPLRPDWEYAVLGIDGVATVAGAEVGAGRLVYLGVHREGVEVAAVGDTVLFLLGGEPFGDDIVMWWNFVGRSHEDIASARDDWEAGADRFGPVVGHGAERIPAPPLPRVRLTRRRRRV